MKPHDGSLAATELTLEIPTKEDFIRCSDLLRQYNRFTTLNELPTARPDDPSLKRYSASDWQPLSTSGWAAHEPVCRPLTRPASYHPNRQEHHVLEKASAV